MSATKVNTLESKRIFLIEDDVVNLAVITRTLIRSGASVYENYSSIGIAKHVEQTLPVDLILLDIMLRRGVNGYDVIEQLKANPATARIPVVAITSLDPETEIPKAKAKGFDGYISKPINSYTFAQDIADIIAGQKKWIVSIS